MANKRQAKKNAKKQSAKSTLKKRRGRKPLTQQQAHAKTLAIRMNARLKLLENNNIKGPAYMRTERLILSASKSFMVREKNGKVRFRTDISRLTPEQLFQFERELKQLLRYESSKPSKYSKQLASAQEKFNANYGTNYDIKEIEHIMTIGKDKLSSQMYGSDSIATIMTQIDATELTDSQINEFLIAADGKPLGVIEEFIDMTQMSDTEFTESEYSDEYDSVFEMVIDLMKKE